MKNSEDLFDGWVICSECNFEHEYKKRIVWSFPWGYKDTRCPRCSHVIEELPGASFKERPSHRYAGSFGD